MQLKKNLYNKNIFKNRNLVILLLLNLNLIACEQYHVGEIYATSRLGRQHGYFNYVINNKRLMMHARLTKGGELYTGDILSVKKVQKIEKKKYPHIPKYVIKHKNKYAYTRLQGNQGNYMDCFILQNSKNNFKKGGEGTCYLLNGEVIDIILERI